MNQIREETQKGFDDLLENGTICLVEEAARLEGLSAMEYVHNAVLNGMDPALQAQEFVDMSTTSMMNGLVW